MYKLRMYKMTKKQ